MIEKQKKMLSIIFPVYFNQDSLPDLFKQMVDLEKTLLERNMELELIFVDDGSGDNSAKLLLEFQKQRANTTVIKLTRNFGAIAAAKAGIHLVSGDCFTIVAADLQEPPEQIVAMVDEWGKGKMFIISVRETRDDPIFTRLLSKLYYKIVRFFVIQDYPSSGFDLMLLDKSLLPNMRELSKKVSAQMYAYWMGYQPVVLKYHRLKRPHGQSRWTLRKKIALFINNITGFTAAPLRLMGLFGLLVATVSFVYGIYILYHALFGSVSVAGFFTLAILGSFFSGFIIMMLALIGEYLWRIFDVTSGKPESIIESVHSDPEQK
ncbi:MAG: glycosyltransferase [Pseudomonadota bacterium]|nr:glycosyltransferase [Pseudomonadota bacterium]